MKVHLDEPSLERLAVAVDGAQSSDEWRHVSVCPECRGRLQARRAALQPPDTDKTTQLPGPGPNSDPERMLGGRVETNLAKGSVIGRYVVVDVLGEGGMGLVYAAYDPELSRKVALKLLKPRSGAQDDSTGRARLIREAQAMAQLNHEHVVSVYDVGVVGEQVFLIMELVEGQTLKRWLRERPRGWREVLAIFREAGLGLAAAHRAGLVHRDFKSDNVLITREGRAKVTDFGLAKAVGAAELDSSPAADSGPIHTPSQGVLAVQVTEVGVVVGTPGYMAPEQLRGQEADARCDVFSFCVALYAALWGERPFAMTDGDARDLLANIEAGAVRPPPAGSKVPAWLRRVVLSGLAADASARPSLDALLRALSWDPVRRRNRLLGALAVTTALGLSVTAFAVGRAAPPTCESPRARLVGVWDAEATRDLQRAFLAVDVPYAASTWPLVQRSLDDFTDQWAAEEEESCRLTRVEKTQSAEMHALRALCLERQHLGLTALVEVLRKPTPKVVERAVDAVGALRSREDCSAQAVVKDPPALPLDETRRLELAPLLPRLARARALAEASEDAAAQEELGPVLTELERLEHQPLLAEAVFLQAKLAVQRSAMASMEFAARAAGLALATGRLRLFAEAATLAADSAVSTEPPAVAVERTQHWLSLADAAIRARGEPADLRVPYLMTASFIANYSGAQQKEANELSRRGAALAEAELAPDAPAALLMLSTRALTLAQRDDETSRREGLDLMRTAIARTERKYGPAHPDVAKRLAAGCAASLMAGATESGDVWCPRALRLVGDVVPRSSLAAYEIRVSNAQHLLLRRRLPEVRTTLAEAEAVGRALDVPRVPERAWVELLRSELALLENQPRQARALAESVIAGYGDVVQDVDALRARTVKGWALLQQGRPADAVTLLEETLRNWEGVAAYAGNKARARFTLAQALVKSGGDEVKAREHALEAREEYARSEAFASEVKEIDAWLARAPGR